jgi:hypothetical protein
MNTYIEIHDNNTNLTGTYKVWYKDLQGNQQCKTMTYDEINKMLTRSQEEDFFLAAKAKYKFKIQSEYDFKTILLNQTIKY